MTFWDRRNDDGLPEKLRGKKPEDIAAALEAAEKAQKDLADAEAARVELQKKFDDQSTEFGSVKQKLQEIEAKLTPEPMVTSPDEPPSPWVEPEKFVDERVKGIGQVAVASGRLTAKMYFMQNLSERDQKIFRKYEKEVEDGVSTFAPQFQVMPQSYMNMFFHTKGVHEAEIRKAESEKTDFFAEPVTRSGGPGPQDQDENKLTAEEEETCRVMHWDPKTYLEQKKGITIAQTQKGAYANFKVPKRTVA